MEEDGMMEDAEDELSSGADTPEVGFNHSVFALATPASCTAKCMCLSYGFVRQNLQVQPGCCTLSSCAKASCHWVALCIMGSSSSLSAIVSCNPSLLITNVDGLHAGTNCTACKGHLILDGPQCWQAHTLFQFQGHQARVCQEAAIRYCPNNVLFLIQQLNHSKRLYFAQPNDLPTAPEAIGQVWSVKQEPA